MTLADDVNLEEYVLAKDDLSGADIKVRTTIISTSDRNVHNENFNGDNGTY